MLYYDGLWMKHANLLKPESNNRNLDSSYPSFSIIIEWENVLLAEKWRAVEMLRRVSKQIVEILPNLSSKVEVIIVYRSDNFEHSQMEQIVNEPLESCSSMIDLKIIPATNLHYYYLKNYGVQQSHRDVLIFIDCDVIPEEGWLVAMLEPFKNPETSVLTGLNLPPKGLYEKGWSIASGCSMCESDDGDQIHERDRFLSSNVAFRRKIIEAKPYPRLSQYRGQCGALGDRLILEGYKILCQPKSRIHHPPPNGLRHFVVRALCQGHDMAVSRPPVRKVNKAPMAFARLDNRWTLRQIFSYLRHKFRPLRLSPKDTVCTLGIVFSYLLFVYIGILISKVKPGLIRRHLSV